MGSLSEKAAALRIGSKWSARPQDSSPVVFSTYRHSVRGGHQTQHWRQEKLIRSIDFVTLYVVGCQCWKSVVEVSMPCPALPCPALPCPALPCPALPCPALPCPALPCPALPCPVSAYQTIVRSRRRPVLAFKGGLPDTAPREGACRQQRKFAALAAPLPTRRASSL